MVTGRWGLVAAAPFLLLIPVRSVARDADSLVGVSGFAIKGTVDDDSEAAGMTVAAVKSAVERGLVKWGVTVFRTEDIVNGVKVPKQPAILDFSVDAVEVPSGLAGGVELRVYQEALLRQGVSCAAVTWHRRGFVTAARDKYKATVTGALDGLLQQLVEDYLDRIAGRVAFRSGPALDCSRWNVADIQPTDKWEVATAVVGKPPIPEYDLQSDRTRMSNWKVTTAHDPATSLMARGVRSSDGRWRVADVSLTYKTPVTFEAVREALPAEWGAPSRCGSDVTRYKFESRGCFWQDVWCDTFVWMVESKDLGYVQVIVASISLRQLLDEQLKLEAPPIRDPGLKKNESRTVR